MTRPSFSGLLQEHSRWLLGVVLVLGAPYLLWRVVRPEIAPNARESVAEARKDEVWTYAPGEFALVEESSYEADASWVPQFPSPEYAQSSAYSRTYDRPIATVEELLAWKSAAALGGWEYEGCARASRDRKGPTLVFSKTNNVRFLEISSENEAGLAEVAVEIPAGEPYRTARSRLLYECSLQDPSTWNTETSQEPSS